MTIEATSDTAIVPCRGCGRDVLLPAGPVRAAIRAQRKTVVFCSRRCERRSVAKEGAKQQEQNLARRVDAALRGESGTGP